MILKQFLVIISLVCKYVNGANILFLNILPSPSHHFWSRNIFYALAERGHNVTSISPDTEKSLSPGVHFMQIDGLYGNSYKSLIESLQEEDAVNPILQLSMLFESIEVPCKVTLESNAVKSLLNYPDNFKFDLVLYDYANGPCLLPFIYKFGNPPVVGITAYGNPSYTVPVAGGHQYYSYVPHNLIIADDNMSFWERVFNFVIHIEEYYLYQISMISAIDKLAKPLFGSNVPSAGELERRISLVLVNTNPVMDYSFPLPENVIPVGGLHIKDPQPLPKDIEEFMNSSTDGVVLFSLGSNFRSDFMPIEKQQMFIEVFRQLPNYHFLWKFEGKISAALLPKNVQIRSWLPLSDALVHSDTKLIIFHGGLLTSQEALWRGVPMIIMPFALDQHQNLIKTRRLGISEGLNYKNLSSQYIKDTLLKVLTNRKYSENAIKTSKRYQDQKEKPLNRAIWWIEWVLRNPNANHLKSPVVRLGFFIGNSFDIFIFVIVVTVVLLILFAMIFFYLIKIIISHNNLWFTTQPKSKTN